eukprot:gi/632977410/ref/XP_007905328.1/ PREDICTED: cdc42-interacting protein 4 [Callorhinchus milii]
MMDWGAELWDQYDNIERHTQWGLDLVEKYVKFVKERTEIEQAYAKQLRNLVKRYSPKRLSKDDHELRFSQFRAFTDILNELNDYAGQREVIAENLMQNICVELLRFSQDLKQERKAHLQEGRKAQQHLDSSFKQLDSAKKKFERDCREAEKALQSAERVDNDINTTKADVEKAKQQANLRNHMADESKNEYASQLQKYNRDQNTFYFTEMPQVFDKLQEMDGRRLNKLCDTYRLFADTEQQVTPIIGKCLEGVLKAANSVDENQDSRILIESYKSGFERPSELEFEDYSQIINRTSSENSLGSVKSDCRTEQRSKSKGKRWLFGKKSKHTVSEDFSHLPPEQRRKKLQQKIQTLNKELQKQVDQREALDKMKDVYEKNPQMGDPGSLEPGIAETNRYMERLHQELQKYQAWLGDAESKMVSRSYVQNISGDRSPNLNNGSHDKESSPDTTYSDEGGLEPLPSTPSELDDFEEEGLAPAIGSSTALYSFDGNSEGTISMAEGETLQLIEEDKGDGWTRVRRGDGEEGYIPTSYVQISLDRK